MPSVQLFTLRRELQNDPWGTFERLVELGIDDVELFDLEGNGELYARALERFPLTAESAHAPLIGQADLRGTLARASELGVRVLVEPAARAGWASASRIRGHAEELNRAGELAQASGLTVAYHNHWWEFGSVEGRTALEQVAEHLDANVTLELDLYWAATAGIDVPALLSRLGRRVSHVHVKDGPLDGRTSSQCPAGQGSVPLDAALTAAPHARPVLEFDEYEGDIFDGIARGCAFLAERAAR